MASRGSSRNPRMNVKATLASKRNPNTQSGRQMGQMVNNLPSYTSHTRATPAVGVRR